MNFGSLLTGTVVGGALVYGSLSYHVLRTNDGVKLVPKTTATFHETYVDVREFGVADWTKHKTLSTAIGKAKMEHIFGGAGDKLQEGLDGVFQDLEKMTKGS